MNQHNSGREIGLHKINSIGCYSQMILMCVGPLEYLDIRLLYVSPPPPPILLFFK